MWDVWCQLQKLSDTTTMTHCRGNFLILITSQQWTYCRLIMIVTFMQQEQMLEKQIMLDSGGNYPPFCDRSFWLVQGFNRMSFFPFSKENESSLSADCLVEDLLFTTADTIGATFSSWPCWPSHYLGCYSELEPMGELLIKLLFLV